MSTGAYAGLRLAARAADTPDDDHDETCTDADCKKHGKGKKKDEQMTDTTFDQAAIDTARAEATTTANARFSTVLASEHYAGREALAKNLLASDLTADAIVTALAASNPAPVAAAAAVDPDAAARAEMKAALAESGNSGVDANLGGKPAADADSGAVWDRAIAKINPGRKTT